MVFYLVVESKKNTYNTGNKLCIFCRLKCFEFLYVKLITEMRKVYEKNRNTL